MKKYLFYVGVDVSKQKLDFNILDVSSFKSEHFVVENDVKSVSTFVKNLNKKIGINQTLFCCENTGVYTNHLSSVLVNLELDLWVVPAIEIKRSKGISRGKTDKSDAKDIAYYSYRNIDKLKLFTLIDTDIQKLKILYTEREKMLKSLLFLETTTENKDFITKKFLRKYQISIRF